MELSQKEIVEANHKIAAFMGWDRKDPSKNFGVNNWVLPEAFRTVWGKGNSIPYETLPTKMLIFHSSWDWLMPVVEKIESTDVVSHMGWTIDLGYFVIEVDTDVESRTLESHKNHKTNLATVYKAVLEFIDWYIDWIITNKLTAK